MLIDEVEITLKGGHGGTGKVSFYPKAKAGPDGGNGGRGGDLYIKVVSDLTALNQLSRKKELAAEDGQPGGSFLKSGRDGRDLEIVMPVGTSLIDKDNGEVRELGKIGERVLTCKGGLGGRGNYEFRSSRNTTPMKAQSGLPGEEHRFKVVLKLIADFGLIGLPNAGKSSLLNELTSANVKTAEYPFTTLEPNLGVLDHKIIADIPGLIEGASSGKGLGFRFLKHIEKVGTLLHCISSQSENVVKDYQVVREELGKFNPELLEKPEIILLTKVDLGGLKKKKKLEKLKRKILSVSIYDWDSIEKLRAGFTVLTEHIR